MIGQEIAKTRPATLYGRADLSAGKVRRQPLQVVARPVPGNPIHACIVGWPADKPAQKIVAQQLAVCAQYRDTPRILPRHLHTDIYGNREFVEHLRNRGKYFDHEESRARDLILIDVDGKSPVFGIARVSHQHLWQR
jgi:hypothetical protein